MMDTRQTLDVVIVGGGLTGAALALALANEAPSLRVGLLDSVTSSNDLLPSFDERVLALSEGSRRLLARLGIWPQLATDACAISQIHVSDRGQYGRAVLTAAEQHVAALGQVVPLRTIGQCLYQALATRPTVTRLTGTISAVEQQSEAVQLTLFNGTEVNGSQVNGNETTTLTARALLAADGGPSSLRALCGLPVEVTDYQQSALIATVRAERQHQHWAYERFTETGPLALLPMTDNRLSLVWTQTPTEAARLLALPESEFLHALQQTFGWRLGKLLQVGLREKFDLRRVASPVRRQGRMLLMGNASLTVHPIAGQGFNLALRDAMAFVEHVRTMQAEHRDPFSPAMLQTFVDARDADRRHVGGVTDALVHLFSNDYPLLRQARAGALTALTLLPPMKRWVARQAMGLVPR